MIRRFLASLAVALSLVCPAISATLLPNGEQVFLDNSGVPLASGSVYFYIPNTLIPKVTYQDSDQTISNTNPVVLDSAGRGIIYGVGSYRQIVKDSLGNTIWDRVTADTSSTNLLWGGLATGTANAIIVDTPNFSAADGQTINFLVASSNTSTVTIDAGTGNINVVLDGPSGPTPLSGSEFVAGNIGTVVYDATNVQFHLVGVAANVSYSQLQNVMVNPQGYLTPVSGQAIITSDSTSATAVYYTPFQGNLIPIYNGTNFLLSQFSELTLTLNSNHLASTIYDVCVFNNSGVITVVTGPAWSNSSAGTSARGTGAGSAQIGLLNGVYVNSVQITGRNGANTYTVSAQRCTYVGSLFIDSAAGQVTNHVSWGQSRKRGIWNAWNRQLLVLKSGDNTANWSYGTNAYRAQNGAAANSVTVFSGLAEEWYSFDLRQVLQLITTTNTGCRVGIGWNSTSSASGHQGQISSPSGTSSTVYGSITAEHDQPPALGINVVTQLETCPSGSASTYGGTESNNRMSTKWRG